MKILKYYFKLNEKNNLCINHIFQYTYIFYRKNCFQEIKTAWVELIKSMAAKGTRKWISYQLIGQNGYNAIKGTEKLP